MKCFRSIFFIFALVVLENDESYAERGASAPPNSEEISPSFLEHCSGRLANLILGSAPGVRAPANAFTYFDLKEQGLPRILRPFRDLGEVLPPADALNKMYFKIKNANLADDVEVFDWMRKHYNIRTSYSPTQFAKIPKTGPVFFAVTHGTGLGDGIAVQDMVSRVRNDWKMTFLTSNYPLASVHPNFKERLLFVARNPKPGREKEIADRYGLRMSLQIMRGRSVISFPAGSLSVLVKIDPNGPNAWWNYTHSDLEWEPATGELVEAANAVVIPIYIRNRNSDFYYELQWWSYLLRRLRYSAELENKFDTTYELAIGDPIYPERWNEIKETDPKLRAALITQEIRKAAFQAGGAPEATYVSAPMPIGILDRAASLIKKMKKKR